MRLSKGPNDKPDASRDTLNRGPAFRKMITVNQVIEANSRARNPEAVATLANDIRVSGVSIRPQDPIQAWESHPVVCKVLDGMKDREIALAIQLANQEVA